MIKKRGKEVFSEPSCDYATLLEFESASCNSSFLHTSENERNPCMMGLEVKKQREKLKATGRGAKASQNRKDNFKNTSI